MKRTTLMLLLAGAAVLSSCGGSDDESGSPTPFSVVPAEVNFTAPIGSGAGVCLAGGTAQVFVYGGVAPYRIDNTSPDYMDVNTTTVGDKGGSFTVTTRAACTDKSQIVVVDKLDKQVILTVSNKPVSS